MSRYLRDCCVLVASVFYLAVPPIAIAEEYETVKIVTAFVEPWGYLNERGMPDGLLVRFVNVLGQEAGVPFTNRIQPYPRVKHSLASGQADMAVMFASPESDRIGQSLGKVVDTYVIMVGRKGKQPISGLSELDGRRVGFIRGSRYGKVFDGYEGFTKVPVNRAPQGIAMLLAGRIEAMVSTDQALFYTLHKMGLSIEEVSPLLIINKTQADLFFSHHADSPKVAEVYRQALKRLRETGRLSPLFFNHEGWSDEWLALQLRTLSTHGEPPDTD